VLGNVDSMGILKGGIGQKILTIGLLLNVCFLSVLLYLVFNFIHMLISVTFIIYLCNAVEHHVFLI
jgi:hypothetical protein